MKLYACDDCNCEFESDADCIIKPLFDTGCEFVALTDWIYKCPECASKELND